MKRSTISTLTGYAFVAPWAFALVVLIGYPFAASFYFSLCDYPPLQRPAFVGLDNYAELALDPAFRGSMLVTLVFALVAIPLGVVLALALAMLLNSRIRGRSIYRVLYYLPHLVPSVVVAILWMWMFNPEFGILNVMLKPFGRGLALLLTPFAAWHPPLPSWAPLVAMIGSLAAWRRLRRAAERTPRDARDAGSSLRWPARTAGAAFAASVLLALAVWVQPEDLRKIQSPGWLTDATPFPSGLAWAPPWALWALVYMSLWGVGQMAVIYLAKLQDVPAELLEAAELDGAGAWRKTVHILVPMISPVILFNVVMAIIGAFQVFAEPYIMTGGGPEDRTRFIAMFIYSQAFLYQRLGYASAVAWVLFVVIVGLTLLALRIGRDRVYYAAR
jgi:ABC-type sugar transport system permease subunit